MKKVIAVFNPKTGEVEYEVNGIIGAKCTDITAVLTQGHEVKDERLTEEYYTPQEEPAYINDL